MLRPTPQISRTASNRPPVAAATTADTSSTPPKSSGADKSTAAAVCSISLSLSSRLRPTATRPSTHAARPAAVAAKSASRAHTLPHSRADSVSRRICLASGVSNEWDDDKVWEDEAAAAAATTRRCSGGNDFSTTRVGKETVEVRVVGRRRVSFAVPAMAVEAGELHA